MAEWLKAFFRCFNELIIISKKILERLDDIYFLLEEEKKNNKYEGE
jgi:hypothetical protein